MTDLKVTAYENYKKWVENADLSLKDDLEKIRSNEKEIVECFYKDLEFGTGGMRGKIGVGSNRMNIHTVARASQGFADFLKTQNQNLSVVIAYDTRNKSELFSKVSAEVFAANGLKVFLFSKPTATPILSYAVRHLHAAGGLVITASHNPKEYNGYKVYTSDGTQAVPVYADIITRNVESLDYFKDVKRLDYEELMKSGMIQILDESVFNSYIETVFNYSKGIMGDVDSNLKVVYTPLHGTGLEPVRTLLGRLGFALDVVEQQAVADPGFSTVKVPNPEDKQAFTLALELARKSDADIVMATDPDSDRIGVFEKESGDYLSFNGNQIGIALSYFLLNKMKEKKLLSDNGLIIKTIVSTDMIKSIAADYGVSVQETLTGFKFIGEKIEYYEKNKEKEFILGFEESYGYLAGTHARDKDAVVAAALICMLAGELKKTGSSIGKLLQELSLKYGFYGEKTLSYEFEGIQGGVKINEIMSKFRNEPPKEISGCKLAEVIDYSKGIANLPKSDVIELRYGDSKVIARPSGTEPKIKFYLMVRGETEHVLQEKIASFSNAVYKML